MARSSIAELSVKISASADAFNSIVNGAEKRVTGFASKISAVPKNIVSGFSGMGRTITNPVDDFMKTADSLLGFLPGGKLISASWGLADGLSGFEESGQRGIDSIRALRREAQRFDVSPKFLRAFQLTGGADADAAGKAISKVVEAVSNLKAGDLATEKALGPFIDIAKLKSAKPEEAVYQVAEAYKALGDQTQRLYLLRGMGLTEKAHYFFAGGRQKIDADMGLVNRYGLYDSDAARASDTGSWLEKRIKLMKEGADVKNALYQNARDVLSVEYDQGKIGLWEYYRDKFTTYVNPNRSFSQGIVDRFEKDSPAPPAMMDPVFKQMDEANARFDRMANSRKAITELTKDFNAQSETLGMSAVEASLYKAELDGISKAEIDAARAAAQRFEVGKKQLGWRDEIQSIRSMQDPVGQLEKKLSDLRANLTFVDKKFRTTLNGEVVDGLNAEELKVRQGQLVSQAFGLESLLTRQKAPNVAPLALQGTQEAYAAIERARNQSRDPADITQDEIRDEIRRQGELHRQNREFLKKIADATTDKGGKISIPN